MGGPVPISPLIVHEPIGTGMIGRELAANCLVPDRGNLSVDNHSSLLRGLYESRTMSREALVSGKAI